MADLTKFDPSSLADQLRDKIRLDLATLMPQEAWLALLKKEIDKFTQPQPRHYGGSDPSDLSKVVQKVLHDKSVEIATQLFNEPQWQPHWDGVREGVSDAVVKLMTEHAGAIFQNMMGRAIQSAVDQLRDSMHSQVR